MALISFSLALAAFVLLPYGALWFSIGRLPLKLDSSIMALSFYLIGYFARIVQFETFIGKFKTYQKVLLSFVLYALVGCVSINYLGWVNISVPVYHNLALYLGCALFGTVATILLSSALSKLSFLRVLGKNSLTLFAIHSFGIYFSCYLISKIVGFPVSNGSNVPFVYSVVFGVLITFGLYFVGVYLETREKDDASNRFIGRRILEGISHSIQKYSLDNRKSWSLLSQSIKEGFKPQFVGKIILNKAIAFTLLGQLLVLLLLTTSGQLLYATNDDSTMAALVGGGYGEPSQYILNMHIVAGYMLSALFKINGYINWLTVWYLVSYVLAFIVLDFVILQRTRAITRVFHGVCLIALFFILLAHFTFTVASYSLAIAGSIGLLACGVKDGNRPVAILSIVCVLLALLNRAEVFSSIALFLFVFGGWLWVRNRQSRMLVLSLILLICMGVSTVSNDVYFDYQDESVREARLWGETRSAALDCEPVPYNEKKMLNEGISASDYMALYNAFYYDYDAVSLEKLESLIDLNDIRNKYNFDCVKFFESHVKPYLKPWQFQNQYRIAFLLILIVTLVSSRKKLRQDCIAIWAIALLVEFVFFVINRSPYRVLMPNYAFAMAMTMYLQMIENDYAARSKAYSVAEKIVTTIVIATIVVGLPLSYCYKNGFRTTVAGEEGRAVCAYMEEHEDKLFLAGDAGVFQVPVSYSIFEYPGIRCNYNLMGNWEIYSKPYMDLMDRYGVEDKKNLLRSSIASEDILYITSKGAKFKKESAWIEQLIDEYEGIDTHFEQVEEITGKWRVYKLVID